MNMKIDEGNEDMMAPEINARDHYKDDDNYDINDPEIDIELPAGAKAGLKDASQDIRMNTDQMNE